MRILQVVPTYFPASRYGGPIRSVHGLSRALVELGHHVEVFTTSLDGPDDLDVPLGRPVSVDGVYVTYFPVPRLRRLAWCPLMSTALERRISEFDIVHLHSVFQMPTLYAARSARRHGVPYVASPRGMLMRGAVEGRNPLIKRLWVTLFEHATYRHAARIHVTADLEAQELSHLGVARERVTVIENGLDIPDTITPRAAGAFASIRSPYVLFLSRISWKKGIDRLLRAWRDVDAADLVIAGNDDEAYQPAMEKLCRELGLDDRVRFVGAADDDAKWSLYADAEIFVLPSYSENFGNVVVEAMAMGVPVVVSDAVGAAAVVTSARAGVVNDGEPASIARDVSALLADAGRRGAMGALGREFVKNHLGWQAIAAKMAAVYDGCIQPDKARTHA